MSIVYAVVFVLAIVVPGLALGFAVDWWLDRRSRRRCARQFVAYCRSLGWPRE